MNRIDRRFGDLANENRKGLITFITAGDPDLETSCEVLNGLPEAGADFIELGMPFSDPMADGPAIQAANQRALAAGASIEKTLDMVREFRTNDPNTPLILMGYYNPIYIYGTKRFCERASEVGVDGLIVVDLPPEEDCDLREPLNDHGIHLIRLFTPTTDIERLAIVSNSADGFLYYVSITGVTGSKQADTDQVLAHLDQARKCTDLPIAVGFGIKTPQDVSNMSKTCDAVVVGSAIVDLVGQIRTGTKSVQDVHQLVRDLSAPLRQ